MTFEIHTVIAGGLKAVSDSYQIVVFTERKQEWGQGSGCHCLA